MEERRIEYRGLRLSPERLQVTLGEHTVDLSAKEALLLECLLTRPDHIVSRERLLGMLWDEQDFVEENTLNVYITRLRKKLKHLGIEEALETGRAWCRLSPLHNME